MESHSPVSSVHSNSRIYLLSMTAVMTAVLCVLAPLSVPVGPIPISLSFIPIFLSLYLLGWKWGTVSLIVYLLLGMMGMPVFTGMSGGLGKLLGPTGGYIAGYFPMAVIAGLIIDRCRSRWIHLAGMAVGILVCYAFGTAWYCIQSQVSLQVALWACVFPFIPFDFVKILLVASVGPLLRRRLIQAQLLPPAFSAQ